MEASTTPASRHSPRRRHSAAEQIISRAAAGGLLPCAVSLYLPRKTISCGNPAPILITAELTFDCIYGDDQDNMEGCFRLPGQDWKVFYFTRWWNDCAGINPNAVWRGGITGVNVQHPKDQPLNQETVAAVLSTVLGVEAWMVVAGPNSLSLK